MKKILSLMLALSLVAVMLVGCGGGDNNGNTDEGAVKLGLGTVNSIAKSKDYVAAVGDTAEVLALGQVDTIMAAATFDKDGKVVGVSIDTAQTKINYDADLQVSNMDAVLKTKVEKGEEYGMGKVSTIGKEWNEQIAELENWMIGKTIAEIKAMNLEEGKPADEDMKALVTISVGDYIAAVEKAYNTSIDVAGADKLGLGQTISIAKSKGYAAADGDTAEVLPMAQADTVIAATAFNADGKVIGTITDTAQIKINFDAEGKVTTDKTAELKTKVEKGEEYGMKKASGIGKEWFEQVAALSEWMSGKTVSEITALPVSEGKTTDTDLVSMVTVTVTDYLAVVEESFKNAK
ncbi:MAG: hypothetical protein NUK65_09460 [Firmicutes bacterium]|nr:hypothetical protein [Bacillota bacterium]